MRQPTFCAAVIATLFWLMPIETSFAQASGSIKCSDGKTYKASVDGGNCYTTAHTVNCSNDKGDTASASCGTANSVANCQSGGNGSCTSARVAKGNPLKNADPLKVQGTNPKSKSVSSAKTATAAAKNNANQRLNTTSSSNKR